MNIRTSITPAVLTAATTMLQAYVPELSPHSLVEALKAFGTAPVPQTGCAEKPLTRKETAALLGVSLNSVNHYVKQGRLSAVKISKRLVRIDPQSVRSMLNFNHAEA